VADHRRGHAGPWLGAAARHRALAWTVVAYCAVVALLADSFDLPGWTQKASPFAQTPRVPLDHPAVSPLLVLALIAAALLAVGCAGLRRRDIGS
jgi:ABC-2 type transport system permease protein